MSFLKTAVMTLAIAALGNSAVAQDNSKPEPIDGASRPLRDSVLDQMVGHWQLSRTMGGTTTPSTADVSWVLNHQFIQLHYVPDRSSPQPYEAIVYIGYDNMSDRYVVHWLDIFGGRISETMGFGTRVPNGIRLLFEYPDGPFTNSMTVDPATHRLNFLLRQKNQRGEWTTFATEEWRRIQ
jgi:hypothetical protein